MHPNKYQDNSHSAQPLDRRKPDSVDILILKGEVDALRRRVADLEKDREPLPVSRTYLEQNFNILRGEMQQLTNEFYKMRKDK